MFRIYGLAIIAFFNVSVFSENPAVQGDKVTMALVNLKAGSGVNEGECELISDRLRSELFNTGKVTMMERSQMQEILKEQGFQQSGVCTDESCLIQMGQMLGVKEIVVGSLGKLGSMFMVNVRTIDVQTSKIVNVVSVDVKGGIEDLVGQLNGIAVKLVGQTEAATVAPVAEVKPEEKVIVDTSKTEKVEPQANTDTTANNDATEIKIIEIDKENNRSRNRSGVSLTMEIGGVPRHYLDDELLEGVVIIDSVGDSSFSMQDKNCIVEKTPLINYRLRFLIKAGPVLNIVVGPSFMTGTETYTYITPIVRNAKKLELMYNVPMIHAGLSFVKRIYPLKINAGIFADFAMMLTSYSLETYSVFNLAVMREDTDLDLIVSPGFRGGVEFLIGSHFGIGTDLVFQFWPRYETEFNFDEFGMVGSDDSDFIQEIQYPSLKVGLIANIYF